MQLAFAFLADYAEAAGDGKMTIAGGDVDTVYAAGFPAVYPKTLALVAKLTLEPGDVAKPHSLRIELIAPDGTSLLPENVTPFEPRSMPAVLDQPLKYTFVLNFPVLVFPTAGKYIFRLIVDDEEKGTVSLHATAQAQGLTGRASGADELLGHEEGVA